MLLSSIYPLGVYFQGVEGTALTRGRVWSPSSLLTVGRGQREAEGKHRSASYPRSSLPTSRCGRTTALLATAPSCSLSSRRSAPSERVSTTSKGSPPPTRPILCSWRGRRCIRRVLFTPALSQHPKRSALQRRASSLQRPQDFRFRCGPVQALHPGPGDGSHRHADLPRLRLGRVYAENPPARGERVGLVVCAG